MKRFFCFALILLTAVPAFSAARKITVAELRDTLASMHAQKKTDAEVATALKQVQLSEQLDVATMNSFAADVPGQLTTEQLFVLQARSVMLPPPASGIPTTPPLDAPAQQALLNKTAAYAAGPWSQLPDLTATKTTLRFQDNIEGVADTSKTHANPDAEGFVNPYNYIRYITSTNTDIALDHGAETLPQDKTPWGRNRMIQVMNPDPNLATVISEAQASGAIQFVRWETVNGKPAAVISYAVNKKKSRMGVQICCFPEIEETGAASMSSPVGGGAPSGSSSSGASGGSMAAGSQTAVGNVGGNIQTNTDWRPYKKDRVPYHGEIFIDPNTGIVVRLITQTEEKNSDMVHQLDFRTDYGPVVIGGKAMVLPVKSFLITEVVPTGETGTGGYSTRTTLFTSDYKNYALGGK